VSLTPRTQKTGQTGPRTLSIYAKPSKVGFVKLNANMSCHVGATWVPNLACCASWVLELEYYVTWVPEHSLVWSNMARHVIIMFLMSGIHVTKVHLYLVYLSIIDNLSKKIVFMHVCKHDSRSFKHTCRGNSHY
jgi:hypothetical protein